MKQKIKSFFLKLWRELKDVKTLIIFLSVCLVLSGTVWVPYLLALITGIEELWAVGSAIWLVWIGPLPFIPICLGITFGVKAIFNKVVKIKHKKSESIEISADSEQNNITK